MLRRRPAAAADDVQPAIPRPLLKLRREAFRSLWEAGGRERIGQTGVRISGDIFAGSVREFFDVRLHFPGAERTVQAHRHRLRVRDRDQKCFHRLTTQYSPRTISHRSRDDERNALAGFFKELGDGGNRGLCIQRVENRFHHQQVHAAFQESGSLFAIGFSNLVERRRAEAGIVYIWRKRCGHRQGTERSADKTAAPSFLGRLIGGATCYDCRLYIDFLHERAQLAVIDDALEKFHAFSSRWRFALKKKIVEADGGAAKSVRLDDSVPILEALAAIVGFTQPVLLDHRAHGAVEHDDTFAHQRFERMEIFGRHIEEELNRSSRARQGTN